MKLRVSSWIGSWAVMMVTLTCCQLAVATVADDRKRIAEARAQADAELVTQEAECQTRFAVTPCLLDAREKHRAIVDPLRRDQLTVDERERQQRATNRREHLSRKAQAAREVANSATAASVPDALDSAPRTTKPLLPIRPRLRSETASSPDVAGDTASAPAIEPSPAEVRRAHTSKRLTPAPDPDAAQRAEDRVRQADERRARVLARNAERNAKKPRAASLPLPGVSTTASSPSP
ncbi:MAG: hypothetical protein WCJ87_00820 [Burkholderiales bacterium]